MKHDASNLVLIGMPGCGKSTVGVVLAKRTSRAFADTDVLIQSATGRALQSIVDREGYLELRRIEEEVLLGLRLRNHVVATGGSAVYSATAMAHLKSEGVLIFLHVELHALRDRVRDFATRGLARQPGQSFAALFEERLPLYRRHADITVRCTGLDQEAVCAEIMDRLTP